MLGCPLATASNTLWFTEDRDRYWQRFYLAAGLSLAVHALAVVGVMLYQNFYQSTPELILNTGTPDVPINVHVVMQQNQTAAARAELKPEPKVIAESVVSTLVANNIKGEIKTTKEKVKEKPVEKPVLKKETANKNTEGIYDANSTAGAQQKSEHVGVNEIVKVTAKPRFRSQPQQPEYPAQAKRRKQQGVVLVNFIVEPNGSISTVNVARSSGFPLLDNAAVAAVKKWELYSHEVNGQAVRGSFNVPVEFNLRKI
jgi:protein TonB